MSTSQTAVIKKGKLYNKVITYFTLKYTLCEEMTLFYMTNFST